MLLPSRVLLLVALAGCSFPELGYSSSTSGGEGGSGATGGLGGQSSSTGGAPNGGGGSGGSGGVGGTTTTEGGGGNDPCVDADNDDYLSPDAPIECERVQPFVGKERDCDDDDEDTHPDQEDFFQEMRIHGGWDYDCSGEIEFAYGVECVCPGNAWLDVSAGVDGCGDEGDRHACGTLGCAVPSDAGTDKQRCH